MELVNPFLIELYNNSLAARKAKIEARQAGVITSPQPRVERAVEFVVYRNLQKRSAELVRRYVAEFEGYQPRKTNVDKAKPLSPSKAYIIRDAFGGTIDEDTKISTLIPTEGDSQELKGIEKGVRKTLRYSLEIAEELGLTTVKDIRNTDITSILIDPKREKQIEQRSLNTWARALVFTQFAFKKLETDRKRNTYAMNFRLGNIKR